jgi:hypothetical protein
LSWNGKVLQVPTRSGVIRPMDPPMSMVEKLLQTTCDRLSDVFSSNNMSADRWAGILGGMAILGSTWYAKTDQDLLRVTCKAGGQFDWLSCRSFLVDRLWLGHPRASPALRLIANHTHLNLAHDAEVISP